MQGVYPGRLNHK